jgi:hypothetical protein
MDERDVEEERKDRKKVHFWNFIFMFVIRNLKTRRANKASCISCTIPDTDSWPTFCRHF